MSRVALGFAVLGFVFSFPGLADSSSVQIIGINGLTVSVETGGGYDVFVPSTFWHFTGNIGVPLTNLAVHSGSDGIGNYAQIGFDFETDAQRHAIIRAYSDHSVVLFRMRVPNGGPNTFVFPNWTQYPENLNHVTFSGPFAPPTFTNFAADSPWVFFDSSANTFIVSAADRFMTAETKWGGNGQLSSGTSSKIATLPSGYEHGTLLAIEHGINRAFDTWGTALSGLHNKVRPANDSDDTLSRIGYWTDNGAAYYYGVAAGLSYPQTLEAVKAQFDNAGIALGSVQLDSWFYPKGPNALWTDNGDGIYQYTASPALFTSGLSNFQQSLNVPLVTHARWIDPSSPYWQRYQMSGNVVIDANYWNSVAAYLAQSGVKTYEQDWLGGAAHAAFNLNDPDTFLDNMATAMAQWNITIQYCMAPAGHFLQTVKYNNITTIRGSEDRFQPGHWTNFLYASRLASALGVWPFTDNFQSAETANLLLATLSAGPVGIGDPLGGLNVSNVMRAVRPDGVIVKPDVPLTPVDSSYQKMAQGADTPLVNVSYSDFGTFRTYYVLAYPQGSNRVATIDPSDLGLEGPAYFYDYFTGAGRVVHPTETVNQEVTNDALYLIAAPIGASGMAILGDVDQFVPMGKKRIPSVVDNGVLHLRVAFAAGEQSRTITGYAPFQPAVTAANGTAGPVDYNTSTNQFRISVKPGREGMAEIRLHRPESKNPRAPQHGGAQ